MSLWKRDVRAPVGLVARRPRAPAVHVVWGDAPMISPRELNCMDIARTATTARVLLRDLAEGDADEQDIAELGEILKGLTFRVADVITGNTLLGPEIIYLARRVLPDEAAENRVMEALRGRLRDVLDGLEGTSLPLEDVRAAEELSDLFERLRKCAYAEAADARKERKA